MIKINKDKIIGNVIFVVEGKVTESKLLEEIFINLLEYDEVYFASDDNSIKKFKHHSLKSNKVLIVTHDYPQISHLNENIEKVLSKLIKNEIDYEDMAIYFIYDRDRSSNTTTQVDKAIRKFKNSRDNGIDVNGVLLLNYPCIEAIYYNQNSDKKRFKSGTDIKDDLETTKYKISDLKTLSEICSLIIKELTGIKIDASYLDDASKLNLSIYEAEEKNYLEEETYVTLSLLFLAFIDLGIIECYF